MRRSTVIILLLIMALAWTAPVYAQDGFSPEEQTALDEVSAALEALTNANTYTADVTQKVTQVISLEYSGQSLQMDQTMSSTGSLQFESKPDNQYDNQQAQMTQTVHSTTSGAQNDDRIIGPIDTQIIVTDDHIYLKVEPPEDLQAYYPVGWQDVTEGADAFPGMGMVNIDSMVSMDNIAGTEFTTNVLSAVRTVVVLEPETVGERTANHYRLGLDPQQALETVGAANMQQLLNADESPFDVPSFIDLLFNDDDTRYDVDFLIFADDQTLYSLSVHMMIDLAIPPGILIDQSLSDADMAFKQDVVQITQISGIDVPVSIQAPELDQ